METIVITGASTGIGYASVEAALAAGYRVVCTARKAEDLARLEQLGAIPVEMELSDQASVERAATAIREHADGAIKALFNNAGYGLQVALEDASWEALSQQLTVNVVAQVALTNQLLDCLSRGSKLVFNSSALGIFVIPFRGPYCMSKFALEAAADAYRYELESLGIAVHVIQPGPIEASFRQNAYTNLQACIGEKSTRLDYSNHLNRLQAETLTEGTLPASAVAELFVDIVAGRKNKTRYPVTRVAKLGALLKRLLGSGFDAFAKRAEPIKQRVS